MRLCWSQKRGLNLMKARKRADQWGVFWLESLRLWLPPWSDAARGSQSHCGVLTLLAVTNRRCHLPSPIWPSCCQPEEHFVFWTVKVKKSSPHGGFSMESTTDKGVNDGLMGGWMDRDYTEGWVGWLARWGCLPLWVEGWGIAWQLKRWESRLEGNLMNRHKTTFWSLDCKIHAFLNPCFWIRSSNRK